MKDVKLLLVISTLVFFVIFASCSCPCKQSTLTMDNEKVEKEHILIGECDTIQSLQEDKMNKEKDSDYIIMTIPMYGGFKPWR